MGEAVCLDVRPGSYTDQANSNYLEKQTNNNKIFDDNNNNYNSKRVTQSNGKDLP